jgi:hypothetical protein
MQPDETSTCATSSPAMAGRSAHLGAAERVRPAPMSRTVRALDPLAVELCLQQAAGVVVQAEDGTVLDHDDAAAGVLRMRPDQLVGASSLDDNWAAVTLDDEPIAGERHPAMRALATDRPVRNFTIGVRGGDDTYRWLRVDSWPTRLDGARVVITQFLDITDEVKARRAVDSGLERLQRHVVPRTAPEISGLLVHLRYRNLVEPLEVGGDFCDIYQASRRRSAGVADPSTGARGVPRASRRRGRRGTPVMDLIDDMIRRADRTDVLRRDDTAVLVLVATTAPVPGDAPTRDNAGSGGPLPALS